MPQVRICAGVRVTGIPTATLASATGKTGNIMSPISLLFPMEYAYL